MEANEGRDLRDKGNVKAVTRNCLLYTSIILKADYLKTLSGGTHSFEIVWADGSAVTSFKVSKNTSDNEGSKDNNGNKDNLSLIHIS